MIITSEMLYKELQQLKALMFELLNKDHRSPDVERELTMNDAIRLLGRGKYAIVDEINAGRLKASVKKKRVTKKGKTKLHDYYKFKRSDLIEYQKEKFSAQPEPEIELEVFDPKLFVKRFHERNRRKVS